MLNVIAIGSRVEQNQNWLKLKQKLKPKPYFGFVCFGYFRFLYLPPFAIASLIDWTGRLDHQFLLQILGYPFNYTYRVIDVEQNQNL